MPFGSVLALLQEFDLTAADGQTVAMRNTVVSRLAFRLIGLPHIGLRIRARFIMGAIARHTPTKVVDAGAGNGLYTLQLAANGIHVHGIEIDEVKVQRVQRYIDELGLGHATLQHADLTRDVRTFDAASMVICSDVLEHIADDESAVRSLRALVRKGGILAVTVPRVSPFAARVENCFDHVRTGYTEQGLRRLLERHNFEVLECGQFFKPLGRLAWRMDRALRTVLPLHVLMFWPLFWLAALDLLLPDDENAGGMFILARARTLPC